MRIENMNLYSRSTSAKFDATDEVAVLQLSEPGRFLCRLVDATQFGFRECRCRQQVAIHEGTNLDEDSRQLSTGNERERRKRTLRLGLLRFVAPSNASASRLAG